MPVEIGNGTWFFCPFSDLLSPPATTTIHMEYETIHEFENLFKAHMAARKGKADKEEVLRFEMELYGNLARLKWELEHGHYKIRPYQPFTIFDPKKRLIYAPSYRDRVVQHCLCDRIIEPVLEKRFIYDNAASRKGKGTHFALNRTVGFLREHHRKFGCEGYILKCDIAKYFDNIDHRILYELLKGTDEFDKKLLWLLREILGSYHTQFGKGLPLGNQSSQWFALYYLDRMDRIVKERLRIKHYSRYMDDCVLIHPDKGYLKHCLAVMKRHVEEERKLSFNAKTQIVPISQGVDYLGFHLYLTETGKVIKRLRTSNKKRLRRKLKHYRRAYASGKIELSAITRSLASYRGHLSHGHTYKLRKNLMNHFILHRKEKGQ